MQAFAVAAAGSKGIVVREQGNVATFGKDSGHGELGNSKGTAPFPLPADNPVQDVCMGAEHTCFLLEDGSVWCCGSNAVGQCGAPPSDVDCELFQVELPQNDATAVGCGEHHTVVLCATGDVYTFGNNQVGQLGRNKTDTPGKVGIKRATSISCGQNHTLIVESDAGSVFGFGDNSSGQLGHSGDAAVGHPVQLYASCSVQKCGAEGNMTWAA